MDALEFKKLCQEARCMWHGADCYNRERIINRLEVAFLEQQKELELLKGELNKIKRSKFNA